MGPKGCATSKGKRGLQDRFTRNEKGSFVRSLTAGRMADRSAGRVESFFPVFESNTLRALTSTVYKGCVKPDINKTDSRVKVCHDLLDLTH